MAFRALEAAADVFGRSRSRKLTCGTRVKEPLEHAADKRLWIFASTIGELNAIEPFLSRYLAAALDPPPLLISDH
jgi:hypothetical protein